MKRLLLDTHVLLWLLADDKRLSPQARLWIERAESVSVSAASYWEMAIKIAKGMLSEDLQLIRNEALTLGLNEIPVSGAHAQATLSLPLRDDHKDPFDRLIVATAMLEPMHLLTADSHLPAYSELIVRI